MKLVSIVVGGLLTFFAAQSVMAAGLDLNAVADKAYKIVTGSGAHEINAELIEARSSTTLGTGPRVEVGFFPAVYSDNVYDLGPKKARVYPLPVITYMDSPEEAIASVTTLVATNSAIRNINVKQIGWAKCAANYINCPPVARYEITITRVNAFGFLSDFTKQIPSADYRVSP